MRLYLFLAILGVVFGIAGFLGLAAGILGIVLWAIAAALLVASWFTYRAREQARGRKDAPSALPRA